LITDLIGNPNDDLVDQIPLKENKEFVRSLPKRKPKDFNVVFKGANPDAIDIMRRMLTFDPLKRISVQEALEHPYMS
jgi:serine/threonine protein kinase